MNTEKRKKKEYEYEKKILPAFADRIFFLVEMRGIEPLTS